MFEQPDFASGFTEKLVESLDLIEKRVELLREHAAAMELERDNLICSLNKIKTSQEVSLLSEGEREEISLTLDRLMQRTVTVEVSVTTPRNATQQQALKKVTSMIDELLLKVRSDKETCKRHLQEFLNTCTSEPKGAINQKFQAAIIECTADDQKAAKKRLESLLISVENSTEEDERNF